MVHREHDAIRRMLESGATKQLDATNFDGRLIRGHHWIHCRGAGSAESRKDFIHKYAIVCKEAREPHFWLRLLAATEIVPRERIEPLINEANELITILTTIIKKSRD